MTISRYRLLLGGSQAAIVGLVISDCGRVLFCKEAEATVAAHGSPLGRVSHRGECVCHLKHKVAAV